MTQESKEKKRSNKIFFIVMILVLVVVNGILWYNNQQKEMEKEDLNNKLESAEALKAELETEYKILQEQLEEYQGENAYLDSLLADSKNKMEVLRKQMDQAIKQGKITQDQLEKYRKQVRELIEERDNYVAKMDSLVEVNRLLSIENETLEQRLDLEKQVTERLEQERTQLTEQVERGSILEAEQIVGSGVKYKGNGKELTTSNAKKAEKIKVCFDILQNRIAKNGDKTFFLRLISPEGSTIAVGNRGSGTFKLAETGEERQYTISGTTKYENARKRVCIYWQQDIDYTPGVYQIELYQEGYLIGNSTMELKAGIL